MSSGVSAPAGRGLVLLVDDEPDITHFLARLAERALRSATPPLVRAAASVADALRILDEVPPDGGPLLVVSDFNLGPGPNGLDLLAEVGKRHPSAKRVLMSGYAARDLPPELASAGLDAFVAKPCDAHELGRLIAALVASAASPSP